ncbi:DUF559 domain-containing protein [Schumannella luteola]
MDISHGVWLRGGASTTAELRALGYSARAIGRAVEAGTLIRARQGHLVHPTLHAEEQLAVAIGGRLTVGRIDFLVGNRLVVEIDGAEFHAPREAFERDRRRDALLTSLGFRVLRFSYIQVLNRWPEVERAILTAVGRGDHR